MKKCRILYETKIIVQKSIMLRGNEVSPIAAEMVFISIRREGSFTSLSFVYLLTQSTHSLRTENDEKHFCFIYRCHSLYDRFKTGKVYRLTCDVVL